MVDTQVHLTVVNLLRLCGKDLQKRSSHRARRQRRRSAKPATSKSNTKTSFPMSPGPQSS